MSQPLLNHIAQDGSRQFAELPQQVLWHELANHLQKLDGLKVKNILTDNVTEGWIDFTFRGYTFTINDQFGDYWFFVNDPTCPDEILHEILRYASSLSHGPNR